MKPSTIASSWLTAFILLSASNAPAEQPSLVDRAAAEALFREGKALMEAGRYDEACPKLAESQRRDPGDGTLLNLGICHARQGKLATAWVELREALALARRDDRRKRVEIAQAEIAALEPRLPRLRLELHPSVVGKVEATLLDGVELGQAAHAAAIPIDPGSHRLELRVTGKLAWRSHLAIEEAQQLTVVVPSLDELDDVAVAEPLPMPAPVPAPSVAPPVICPPAPVGVEQRIAGYVVGAAGVVGLGVGIATGVMAFDRHAQSNDACPEGICSRFGADLEADAKSFATASNVGFGLGLGLLAAGVVIVLTAPDDPGEARISLHVTPTGAALGSSW
jgi:hypothetical protein